MGIGKHADGQPFLHAPWPCVSVPRTRAAMEEVVGASGAFVHSLCCFLSRSSLQVNARHLASNTNGTKESTPEEIPPAKPLWFLPFQESFNKRKKKRRKLLKKLKF